MTGDADEFWAWAVVMVLWAASLWRLPIAIMRPKSRTLWGVFTVLAVSMTTRLQAVSDWLYDVSGVADAATLVKHLVGTGAVALLLRWVTKVVPGRADGQPEPRYRRVIESRRRRAGTAAAIIATAAVFPLSNRQSGRGVDDAEFIYVQAGHFWGSIHLLLFYAYLIFGLTCATMMCAEAGRRDHSALGRGLTMMALGCAIGTGYGLTRSLYLLVRLAGRPFVGGEVVVGLVSSVCLLACVTLVLLGSLTPFLDRINRVMDSHALINDLRPMWEVLTRAVPEAVHPHAARRSRCSRLRESASWGDVDYRLRRRVTEVHDAGMELQGYIPRGLRERVKEAADHLGLPQDAARAYLLRVAMLHQQEGEVSTTQARYAILQAEHDVQGEAHALLGVGRALLSPEMMERIDRYLASHPPSAPVSA